MTGTSLRAAALVALSSGILVLSGCGSKAPKPANTAAADQGAARAPEKWFCQVGKSNDEWECVQDDALAKKHQPTRLPEPRGIARAEPLAPASPTAPADTQPSAAQSASAVPPPTAEPTDNGVPPHVALSYQPDGPVAILDLPKELFAVQLVAVSTKEALEEYARSQELSGLSAARIWNGEKIFYVLLLGIYESHENAERAVASLSGLLTERTRPWIRSVGSLQHAMLEADRITGTQDY